MLASMTETVSASARRVALADHDAQDVGVFLENRGRRRRSRCAKMLMGGMAPKDSARVTATAAPVGVVSSMAGPRA